MSARQPNLAMCGVRVAACAALLAATFCMAQDSTGIPPAAADTARALRARSQGMADDLSSDSFSPATLQTRLRQIETARYKSMVADADRLQKLATELYAQRTKGGGGPLTGDQLRKLAEIEKLARRMKETMRADSPITQDLMPAPLVIPAMR
jgi:membrane-bound lytic murein transglycosylase B